MTRVNKYKFVAISKFQRHVNDMRKFKLGKRGVRGYVIDRLNNLSYY